MTQDEFLTTMQEDVLDTDRTIMLEMKLKDIEEWDSLAYVSYIAMANTKVGKKVDRMAVQDAATIGDLYALLQ